jgi:hypothetical protein
MKNFLRRPKEISKEQGFPIREGSLRIRKLERFLLFSGLSSNPLRFAITFIKYQREITLSSNSLFSLQRILQFKGGEEQLFSAKKSSISHY